MVRLVNITLPAVNDPSHMNHNRSVTGQSQYELLMDLLMEMDHVHCLAAFTGNNCHLLSFKSPDKHVSTIVDQLERLGVGINFGTIDVMELLSTQPRISTYGERDIVGRKARKYQWNERLSMTEVYETIDQQSHLTFNYVAMVFTAALIAAVGLVSDSTTTVVASMLVSPLMGPILSLTLGIFVRSKEMIERGLRNELWGLAITVLTGVAVGFVIAPFHGPGGVDVDFASYQLRSSEMESRGEWWVLVTGFAVAVPSGIGVSLAITGGGINALVGVAISAALLPPIVNSGIGLALGIYYAAESHSESHHFLQLSLVSFLLFVVNFFTIMLVGLFMFRLKNVEPLKDRSDVWHHGMHFNQSLLSSSFRSPGPLVSANGPLFDPQKHGGASGHHAGNGDGAALQAATGGSAGAAGATGMSPMHVASHHTLSLTDETSPSPNHICSPTAAIHGSAGLRLLSDLPEVERETDTP